MEMTDVSVFVEMHGCQITNNYGKITKLTNLIGIVNQVSVFKKSQPSQKLATRDYLIAWLHVPRNVFFCSDQITDDKISRFGIPWFFMGISSLTLLLNSLLTLLTQTLLIVFVHSDFYSKLFMQLVFCQNLFHGTHNE